jgi:hypothetical protein
MLLARLFAAGLCAAAAFCAGGHAAPSGFAPGSGTLEARPLPVQVPAGMLSPLSSTVPPLLLKTEGAEPVYYLAAGLGVPRYGIADLPGAGAWRVAPDADCAHLEPVALGEVGQPGVQPVTVQQNALPLQCAAAFEGGCTSRDQRLRIVTAFQGSLYTGVRTLTIEHLPSGRHWRMEETLRDTAAYSAPQTAIRYLPQWQRLLLLGVGTGPAGPQGLCIVLPPG